MHHVVAYQVASTINIKEIKKQLSWQLLFQDSDEAFYTISENAYVYVFQYGVVSFFNVEDSQIQSIIKTIQPSCNNVFKNPLFDDIEVFVEEKQLKVGFEKIIIPSLDQDMIRLVMLNTSQSVALDRYDEITESLIIEINQHTRFLEEKGKLDISGHKLKKFIGKILNIKNRISENLYIFDSPDSTWDNEILNTVSIELKKTFDLQNRYRSIHERIDIIKENLELFKDIMDHKESSRLEWIIIILIVIEVFDMFVEKIIKFIGI
ncbi:RMD1 family protein [Aurantibacter aestuarii]|uniref:DUF155 domain-containing protein n=1 Tax=Aurantibacter aestuarii TaxID=1266046 RepID=A0A2T1NE71_9FLAO|nr:RMD1 family protein [Aurantibacter aestuarii]PSG90676.1 hypothetical protein C7H52_05190 [Aurantibacter aestuarii]